MDNATKCQTHSKGLHYGREHIEREIYNEKGFSIGAELFEEIVRCKDCKHAYKRKPINKTAVLCELFGAGMKDNDFCSYGERGNNANTD